MIFVFGVGIYINLGLNVIKVIVKYLRFLFVLIESRGNGRLLIIWVNIY